MCGSGRCDQARARSGRTDVKSQIVSAAGNDTVGVRSNTTQYAGLRQLGTGTELGHAGSENTADESGVRLRVQATATGATGRGHGLDEKR